MRKLTIKRNKSFVASLAKLKVYIEDHENNELTISGFPCRKLGLLKNGEESTFEIGDNAAKVFVIADNMSRNYSNDCYQLEEGTEDIYLTGQNKFGPSTGNAFRFDNNNHNFEINKMRKTNSQNAKAIYWVVFVIALIVGFIFGYLGL